MIQFGRQIGLFLAVTMCGVLPAVVSAADAVIAPEANYTAEAEDGSRLLGDVNDDGEVNIGDALSLFRYSMLPEVYPVDYAGTLDLNGDGKVDIGDALRLFQYSMLPEVYPIEWGISADGEKLLQVMDTVGERLNEALFGIADYETMEIEERKVHAEAVFETLIEEGLVSEESVLYDEDNRIFTFLYDDRSLGIVSIGEFGEINGSGGSMSMTAAGETITESLSAFSEEHSAAQEIAECDALVLWSFGLTGQDDPAKRRPFYTELEADWESLGLDTTVDWDVTAEDLRDLGGHDVIVFSGHGGFTDFTQTIDGVRETRTVAYYVLAEQVTPEKDVLYLDDMLNFRVGTIHAGSGTWYLVTNDFFFDHYDEGDLDGTFVFSENCQSMGKSSRYHSNAMANAFLEASAEAYVGFYNSVMADYSREFMKTYVEELIGETAAKEAFDRAVSEHGENDGKNFLEEYKFGPDATPHFMGNEDAKLVDRYSCRGSVGGYVTTVLEDGTVTPFPNVQIEIYNDSGLFAEISTDLNGYYFAEIPNGNYYVSFFFEGYKEESIRFTVFGKTAVERDISLGKNEVQYTVSGKVTDGTAALAGITVSLTHVDTDKSYPPVTTASDGSYAFTVPDGRYTLIFAKTGYETWGEYVEVNGGDVTVTTAAMVKKAQTVASGTCGDNLTWVLNDKGSLTVSGTGAMWDWSNYSHAPWYEYMGRITAVTVGEGVTSVGAFAFHQCDSITEASLADSVVSIGERAFNFCGELTSITFGDRLTSIGAYAFFRCERLTGLTLGTSLAFIGAGAFNECKAITSLTIPSGVVSVGEGAFGSCEGLTSLVLSEGIKTIETSAFYRCMSLKSVTIPDTVTTIGDDAFSACFALERVYIGSKVSSIGNRAFSSCTLLAAVELPTTVSFIGDRAFAFCNELKSALIPNKEASFGGTEVFYGCSDTFTLHGCAGSTTEAYAAANGHSFTPLSE